MGLMPASIALLFPGQGSHAEGMEDPYRGHPLLERGLELLGYDPFERLSEGTRYQQPALFLCSVAAWDAWRSAPAEDDAGEAVAAAGHSLGEYAALVAAGALRFDDAVALVDERAAAMAEAGEQRAGGMIAMLGGESRDVRALAERHGLVVANDNAPGQLVLSGPVDALDADRTPVSPMQVPVYSNGNAAPFVDVRAELAGNLLRAVRWRETLLALRAAGVERFVELGPGAVLTGLVKRTLAAA
jgi:malonyl CoA-acyl carrier protein transacylase